MMLVRWIHLNTLRSGLCLMNCTSQSTIKIEHQWICNLLGQKRPFLAALPAPRQINHLDVTKTLGKTFAVLASFCHSAA